DFVIATNNTERLRVSATGALTVKSITGTVNSAFGSNDRIVVADGNGVLSQVAPSGLFSNLTGPVSFPGGISTTTLTTSGAATLNSLAVNNNATVGGTLGVTGATTLTGALTANSGLTLNNLATGVTTNDLLVIDGSNVVKRIAAANFTTGNNWSLTGNAATTAGTNFLGTTDNTDMVFKTNNAEAMRVLNSGNVRIGTTTSTYGGGKLEIIADSTTGVFVNQRASGGGTGYSFDSNYGEFLRWSRFGGKAFSMAANGVDGALVISGSNTLNFTVPGILIGGVDTTYPLPARLQVNSTAAADKVLVLKGFAAQSGNLLEFQSSAGSVIASVNAAGAVTAPNLSLTNLATGVTSNDVLVIDGSNVVKRIPASSFASGTNWSLTGNAGTTPGTGDRRPRFRHRHQQHRASARERDGRVDGEVDHRHRALRARQQRSHRRRRRQRRIEPSGAIRLVLEPHRPCELPRRHQHHDAHDLGRRDPEFAHGDKHADIQRLGRYGKQPDPDQQRIRALNTQKKQLNQQLKTARAQQQLKQAQTAMQKARPNSQAK
ncbi:MAG: hypothetical protein EBR51_09995, partial [Gammaproteobacteria bacterium]|nr:hypothetical protein [Gammaproteobacteria bacterium]